MGWWTDGLQGRVLLLEQGNKADTEGSHSQGKERWGFIKEIRKETTPRVLWLRCYRQDSWQQNRCFGGSKWPLGAPGPGGPLHGEAAQD